MSETHLQKPLVAPSPHRHGPVPFEQFAPQVHERLVVTITMSPQSNPAGQGLPPEQSTPHQNLQLADGVGPQLAELRGSLRHWFAGSPQSGLGKVVGSQGLQKGVVLVQALPHVFAAHRCSKGQPMVAVHRGLG
jgi:hypothetical protein